MSNLYFRINLSEYLMKKILLLSISLFLPQVLLSMIGERPSWRGSLPLPNFDPEIVALESQPLPPEFERIMHPDFEKFGPIEFPFDIAGMQEFPLTKIERTYFFGNSLYLIGSTSPIGSDVLSVKTKTCVCIDIPSQQIKNVIHPLPGDFLGVCRDKRLILECPTSNRGEKVIVLYDVQSQAQSIIRTIPPWKNFKSPDSTIIGVFSEQNSVYLFDASGKIFIFEISSSRIRAIETGLVDEGKCVRDIQWGFYKGFPVVAVVLESRDNSLKIAVLKMNGERIIDPFSLEEDRPQYKGITFTGDGNYLVVVYEKDYKAVRPIAVIGEPITDCVNKVSGILGVHLSTQEKIYGTVKKIISAISPIGDDCVVLRCKIGDPEMIVSLPDLREEISNPACLDTDSYDLNNIRWSPKGDCFIRYRNPENWSVLNSGTSRSGANRLLCSLYKVKENHLFLNNSSFRRDGITPFETIMAPTETGNGTHHILNFRPGLVPAFFKALISREYSGSGARHLKRMLFDAFSAIEPEVVQNELKTARHEDRIDD